MVLLLGGNLSQHIPPVDKVSLFPGIAFIPLWILPRSFSALSAGAFCLQFGVQGAWGVVSCELAFSSQVVL